MATTCGRKSMKHKLAEALATTSTKKPRLSSSPRVGSKNDDSGIGSSVPSRKKSVVRKATKSTAKVPAKRRLEAENCQSDSDEDDAFMDVSKILLRGERKTSPTNKKLGAQLTKGSAKEKLVGETSSKQCDSETSVSINTSQILALGEEGCVGGSQTKTTASRKNRSCEVSSSQVLKEEGGLEKSRATATPPSRKKTSRKVVKTPSKTSAKRRLDAATTNPSPVDIADMDVSQILALGEGTSSYPSSALGEPMSDSDESDWEEVGEEVVLKEPVIPENGVNITLEAPLISFKRKKKEFDLEGEVRRQLKRRQKELQELMHKVHLLCWIAHIKFVNAVLNSDVILVECHKVLSSKNYYPPKHADLAYLERMVKVFRKNINLNEEVKEETSSGGLEVALCSQFQNKTALSKNSLIYMFIVFLRTLGLRVRYVTSVVAVPLKPTERNDIASNKRKTPSAVKEDDKNDVKPANTTKKTKEVDSSKKAPSTSTMKSNLVKNLKSTKPTSKKEKKPQPSTSSNKNIDVKKIAADSDSDDEPLSKHFKDAKPSGKKISPPAKPATALKTKNTKKEPTSSDDDFSPVSKPAGGKKKLDRRVLSSDDDTKFDSGKKRGQDVWLEVFLEAEEKWISVDIIRQKVHCIQFLYARATSPVVYVLACNNDSTLKDVTRRYVPHWHSDTRKKRVAEEWWMETMRPYLPPSTAQEREEDEDIARQLQDMPLPASISEYKSHPLYALKRHLLKFEGIYPPEAPTLGFVRGEPVYGRECVVTLRSREIWFKEARVVRVNETPYKIVKSRPKYDKMTGEFKKDLPLELFGVWQTEDYIPPIAVDGKVPRNEYGNVDLFKPCMLPGGTVHLQIPALNRVARKLGIDCAPAVIGFEFHSGGSHPVHDGFVVCEEFKEKLLDAWNKEIDESARRAEERRDKRVYGNWRRLIRGLLIRENLKMKYAFGENSDDEETAPSTSSSSDPTPSTSSSSEPPAKKKRNKFCKK